MSQFGHLRPLMPQKTRVGNDRSQSTTDVARRRNRNEKLYKAGDRSSVTLAAQNADRRAAVQKSNWRYRPVAACRAIEKRTPRTLFCIENGPRRGANSAWLERRSIVERTSSMS